MEIDILQKKKDIVEIRFDDKTFANALNYELLQDGVDAYVSEPHPLISEYILHVEADNAPEELKRALNRMKKNWAEFGRELEKKLK